MPPTKVRYLVLGLLAFAASSAYLTRHCLGVMNTTMQAELDINNEQFGYLYSAFSLGYLLFQIPGGWLGQRLGTRVTMPGLSVVWSLCTVVTAVVASLFTMIAARFVFGLAQAGLVPNSAKVVKDWFPVAVRGKASSICAMAMSLGGIITISLTAWLMKEGHDWRGILQSYSLVGIAWAVAFYFFFRTRPKEHPWTNVAEQKLIREGDEDEDEGEPPKMDWSAAFRDRNTWALCGQLIFKAAGYNFFVTFFPAFLEYKYSIAKADAGMLTTYPLIGVVLGSLCGGVVIDGLFKKTGSKYISRCGVASVALALTASFAFGSTFTGSAEHLATVIAIGSFFSGMAIPCPWVASIDMGGKNPALVMGMMNAAGCLAGICISPLIGRLIDHIKATDGNWNIVIFVHAGFYLCAALLWLFVNPNKTIGQPAKAKANV